MWALLTCKKFIYIFIEKIETIPYTWTFITIYKFTKCVCTKHNEARDCGFFLDEF